MLAIFAIAGCNKFNTEAPDLNLEPEPVDKAYGDVKTFSNKVFYCLIVGNDSRNGTVDEGKGKHGSDGHQRSDVMMLARVDPKSHLISLISIPRDTQSQIDGEVVKINESYDRGGIKGIVAKVEEYTGVNIKYYFDVNFAEFGKLIDALGGVDVNVIAPMTFQNVISGGNISIEAGDQHLNGEEALVFARVRKIFNSGDATRQYNDRSIIISLVNKAITHPEELTGYIDDFMNIVHTNMSYEAMLYYATDFMDNADDVKYISASFPWEGADDPATGLWLTYYDPAMWKSIMDVFREGGDPNSVYTTPIG
ncbi:MAG: LCP family protein [Coriobacteriia bacterium]|nr:LCP family protein [Coriobacteriia bacterium]